MGIGEISPQAQAVDYIALRSPTSGSYHFFLDNVTIRRHDGSIKAVVWASRKDSLKPVFLHCGKWYESWEAVSAVSGIPFSELSIRTVE